MISFLRDEAAVAILQNRNNKIKKALEETVMNYKDEIVGIYGRMNKTSTPDSVEVAKVAERIMQEESAQRRITNDGISYPIPYVIVLDAEGEVDSIYTKVDRESLEDIKNNTPADLCEIILGTRVLKKEFIWK